MSADIPKRRPSFPLSVASRQLVYRGNGSRDRSIMKTASLEQTVASVQVQTGKCTAELLGLSGPPP